MRRPTLFLTVGLPCTGKTTAARRIEVEHRALRLTKDEWVKALYGHENPPPAQDVIEAEAPHTTWPISDEELVEWAAKIDIPTRGELDGSEPVDDPPAGFATWDEWRRHRWPPSVS